jgi:hypothetical protein
MRIVSLFLALALVVCADDDKKETAWEIVVPLGKRTMVVRTADGSTRERDDGWTAPVRGTVARGNRKLEVRKTDARFRVYLGDDVVARHDADCREVCAAREHRRIAYTVEPPAGRPAKVIPRDIVLLDLDAEEPKGTVLQSRTATGSTSSTGRASSFAAST